MIQNATPNSKRFRGSPLAQRIGSVVLAAMTLLYLTVITYSMADRLDSVKRVSVFVFLWFIGIVALVLLSRAWPNRRKPSASNFAWALLFLSSGRMPPPPPQSQIEQEAEERKNRAIDRSDES